MLEEAVVGASPQPEGDVTADRWSVSCMQINLNGVLVYAATWSQKNISLLSCEAEYNAAVSGGAELFFLKHLVEGLTKKTV